MMAARRGNSCSRSMAHHGAEHGLDYRHQHDVERPFRDPRHGRFVADDGGHILDGLNKGANMPMQSRAVDDENLEDVRRRQCTQATLRGFGPGKHEPLNGLESVRRRTKSARRQLLSIC